MNNVSQHAISSHEWVMPPELGQNIPRTITMKKSIVFLSVFLFITGFLIFIISQVASLSYTRFYHLENLNIDGVRAEGITIKLSSFQIKGRHPRMGYFVTYNYMTRPQSDEDKILTGNDEIEQALFARLRVGYRIPIIYDPQNPIDSIQNVTGPARFQKI